MVGYGTMLSAGRRQPFIDKQIDERVVICVTCGLSILGSLLIILSYVCFRSLRTRTREIIVHISVMDLGCAATNLVGAAAYFDQYYRRDHCFGQDISVHPRVCPVNATINALCVTQAFFAGYFTYGSILWTLSLSLYLYFLIAHHDTSLAKYCRWLSYVVCYALPLCVCVWLLVTGHLGYSPYESEGWCALRGVNPLTRERSYVVSVIGYDLWIYMVMVLIPVLSLSVHLHIKFLLKDIPQFYGSERLKLALQRLDYKFLLIPVAFVILRVWSCIEFAVYSYAGMSYRQVPTWIAITLIYLSGIGDSGQGLVNVLIFVIFSKPVRERMSQLLCYPCCCGEKKHRRYVWTRFRKPVIKGRVNTFDSTHSTLRPDPSSDYRTPW